MLLLAPAALAYETDQITRRLAPLADAAPAANAEVDRMLAEAIRRTNDTSQCRWKDLATRKLLAFEIYRVTGHAEYVPDRGEFAGMGHGAYAAWLETAPNVERRTFLDRSDIYGDLTPAEALVLGAAGVCSTVNLGGVLMGTDKPDHFFSQGFEYLVLSRFGKNDARALAWGTTSERGPYGLLTSDAFSWADLYANWQGYQFYKALLTEGSVLARDEDGCVTQTRPWSWAEWLDDAADEALNPPVYTPEVAVSVRGRLARERETVCAEYATWGPAVAARRAEILVREAPRATPKAPARQDEWGLDTLCAPEIAAAREKGTVATSGASAPGTPEATPTTPAPAKR